MSTEKQKKCAGCLHWWAAVGVEAMGECRRGVPTPNGRERGIWPLTLPDDVCGYHRSPEAGPGRRPMLTDGEIWEIVRDLGAEPPEACGFAARKVIMRELIGRGMSRSTVQARLQVMQGRGALEFRAELGGFRTYGPSLRAVADWAGAADPAPMLEQPKPVGRPKLHTWEVYEPAIRTIFDTGAERLRTYSQLHRACRQVQKIGGAAFERLLKEAVEAGHLVRESDGYYMPPQPAAEDLELAE